MNTKIIENRLYHLTNQGKIYKKRNNGRISYFITAETNGKNVHKQLSYEICSPEVSSKTPMIEKISPFPITQATPNIKDINIRDKRYEALENQMLGLKQELTALRYYIFEELNLNRKDATKQCEQPKNSENQELIKNLLDEIQYLRDENKTKNAIIKTLIDNQDNPNRYAINTNIQTKNEQSYKKDIMQKFDTTSTDKMLKKFDEIIDDDIEVSNGYEILPKKNKHTETTAKQ